MHASTFLPTSLLGGLLVVGTLMADDTITPLAATDDLSIAATGGYYVADYDMLVFEVKVAGQAGATAPKARGQMDGAPVLTYAFPTTLSPTVVGFDDVEGILTLVATSHPDFDDTPLWDEQGDGRYDNDGIVFHSHWVVLTEDDRAPGGLAVREITDGDSATLPPTNAGMPLYLDSPGLSVVLQGDTLRILVPAWRVQNAREFSFDAVTAYLEVNTSDDSRPMLGIYEVYDVASGDLSLPYRLEDR
ncbi:hypothetical protein [Halomonas sp. M20]|uniref:hypothetical protein n=1 Tax=Halomonas sp. M20 TaxID=2763264 RepID=UPI001D0B620D|nr:hypothetical protein [Halomonas sp. M20]